jgi:hypothetical protein
MFALDGDVFSLEVASFHKFRKCFGNRCLWSDRIGSNNLDTAEFSSLGGSLITVQQSNIGFVGSLYQRQTLSALHHGDSLDRAYLTAYSAALAIVHIYLDRYGLLDNGIRAVHPAEKA